MNNIKYSLIFDMDGTLYKYDKGQSCNFHESIFHRDIKNRIIKLIRINLNLDESSAIKKYNILKMQYDGDVSKAISTELKLSEKKYFNLVWGVRPDKYIKKDKKLKELFSSINCNFLIVTGAPSIWAKAVLKYLEIDEIVGKSLVTCEFPYKKPDPRLFEHSLSVLQSKAEFTFSIGDDEDRDIVPAKKIGMKTVMVGQEDNTSADFKAKDIYSAFTILRNHGYII